MNTDSWKDSYILCPPGEGFFTESRNKTMTKLTPQNEQQEKMVQILLAKMQGLDVEVYAEKYQTWVKSSSPAVVLNSKYRIKSHELLITREMWAMIDKKWNYAALDENGEVWFYRNTPYYGSSRWDAGGGEYTGNKLLNINIEGVKWQLSLTKRPEGV